MMPRLESMLPKLQSPEPSYCYRGKVVTFGDISYVENGSTRFGQRMRSEALAARGLTSGFVVSLLLFCPGFKSQP